MKLSKLFLISLAVIFLSCGDDDDDPQPTSEGLAGTWAVTAIAYEGTTTTSGGGMEMEADFTGTGKNMDLDITFNENPDTFTSQGDYTIVMKTTMGGQSITQDYPFEGFLTDGTWELDGKIITVTGPSGPQEATIIEQTATTLKMAWDYTDTQSQQGLSVEMDVHGVYTFKKK
jgi:hypothetical protein